jgi:hypothetical protein
MKWKNIRSENVFFTASLRHMMSCIMMIKLREPALIFWKIGEAPEMLERFGNNST